MHLSFKMSLLKLSSVMHVVFESYMQIHILALHYCTHLNLLMSIVRLTIACDTALLAPACINTTFDLS